MKTNLAHQYYQRQLAQMEEASKQASKPRLLLHTCCGPCVAFPIELLAPLYNLTLIYNNSNIDPEPEYVRRRDEMLRFVDQYNQTHHTDVQVVVTPYHGEEFTAKLARRAHDDEGQGRCRYCYALRLQEAFAYAHEHHFDWVGTVMTISRQKDALALNRIGEILERKYEGSPRYFYSNFKKGGGLEAGMKRAKAAELYRQTYCGCRFSRQARDRRLQGLNEQEKSPK
jgi:predicted adenine nucleotide alpha hydrolase (AANH) superfamily ATPase